MGLELKFYFNAADFKAILCENINADSIEVNVFTVISGEPEIAELKFNAFVYDVNKVRLGGKVDGCPTPCKP